MKTVLPGSTIGILGSGQLGRMLAQSALQHGYHTIVFGPEENAPAHEASRAHVTAAYEDEEALARFAQAADVVTVEFENVPARALEIVAEYAPVRPGPVALHTCQNRAREKQFLRDAGLPHVRTAELAQQSFAQSHTELQRIRADYGRELLVKTAGFGYDGKGQIHVTDEESLNEAAQLAAREPVVVEEFVNLAGEFSILLARSANGEQALFEPIVNAHREQILHTSYTGVTRFGQPDGAPGELLTMLHGGLVDQANEATRCIAELFDYVGLLAVEFFVSTDGRLYVNEIAPRTHNSGHVTIEACDVSQFDQQLRAICGLPLGDARFIRPAVMTNVLGDEWAHGEPDWAQLLANPGTFLHLYGKAAARAKRKMGHITRVGETLNQLL